MIKHYILTCINIDIYLQTLIFMISDVRWITRFSWDILYINLLFHPYSPSVVEIVFHNQLPKKKELFQFIRLESLFELEVKWNVSISKVNKRKSKRSIFNHIWFLSISPKRIFPPTSPVGHRLITETSFKNLLNTFILLSSKEHIKHSTKNWNTFHLVDYSELLGDF